VGQNVQLEMLGRSLRRWIYTVWHSFVLLKDGPELWLTGQEDGSVLFHVLIYARLKCVDYMSSVVLSDLWFKMTQGIM